MINFFKLSKFFLYLSIFSVVIVTRGTLFPFIVGKYVFFRTAVDLALIFFLIGLIRPIRPIRPIRLIGPIGLAVTVFVLLFLISGFLGYDPGASFWSNFERGEGGFQMLHFYVFFLLLVLLFRKESDWRMMFMISLIAAFFVILYGIGAGLRLEKFIGPDFGPGNRFQGSLGNPAYLGTYLIFILFYTLHLLFSAKRKSLAKIVLIVLVVFYAFFFWLSETRGAFLGLGAGIFAFLLYLIFRSGIHTRRISLAIVTLLMSLGIIGWLLRDTPFIKAMPGGRLFNVSLKEQTAKTRVWTWGSALKGFEERPIFGWGPENFSVVFDKYFDTRHFNPNKHSETWFDRAHSVYFDYLVETGILGLLSYLAIFAVFYSQFFQTRINADNTQNYAESASWRNAELRGKGLRESALSQRKSAFERALLFSLPIAYLTQGVILFDVLPIYLNLFLFLAFANYTFGQRFK